jgi:WhiB family redox-sensing transcriptional regulator
MRGLEWMKDAACKGKTQYFYGAFYERPGARAKREKVAKSICARCKSVELCRAHARKNLEMGIWGGETDEERFNAGYQTGDASVRRRIRAREYKARRRARLAGEVVLGREGHAQG